MMHGMARRSVAVVAAVVILLGAVAAQGADEPHGAAAATGGTAVGAATKVAVTADNGTAGLARTEKVYSEFVRLDGKGKQTGLAVYEDWDERGRLWRWRIAADGHTKATLEQPGSIYDGPVRVKTIDMNGDGRAEILLYRRNTGSGGAEGLCVYEPFKGWRVLFDMDEGSAAAESSWQQSAYDIAYKGKGKVAFKDLTTGLQGTIPIDVKQYGDDEASREAELAKIGSWVDPIQEYDIADANGDGHMEITALQRIIGVSHADTVGQIRWTFKLRSGKYEAIVETLANAAGKPLAEKRLRR